MADPQHGAQHGAQHQTQSNDKAAEPPAEKPGQKFLEDKGPEPAGAAEYKKTAEAAQKARDDAAAKAKAEHDKAK